jgi:hypothetical protein
LADSLRPDAPDIGDEQASHIDDEEMARLNIEISAALDWWLTLRGEDDPRYWDLVHRSLAYLSIGPKSFGPLETADMLPVCTMPEMDPERCRTTLADAAPLSLACGLCICRPRQPKHAPLFPS